VFVVNIECSQPNDYIGRYTIISKIWINDMLIQTLTWPTSPVWGDNGSPGRGVGEGQFIPIEKTFFWEGKATIKIESTQYSFLGFSEGQTQTDIFEVYL
jgi:hypothetical protein